MAQLTLVSGSVCAPQGFRAAGVAAGIKPSGNPDVALILSDSPCNAAAVFTTNRVCAAPVLVSRRHLADGKARAVAVNAGCANACTGDQGMRDAERMAEIAASLLEIEPSIRACAMRSGWPRSPPRCWRSSPRM